MVHTELAEFEDQKAKLAELDNVKEQCTLLAEQTSTSADELERAGKVLKAQLAELGGLKEQCTLLAKQKDELERACRLLSEQKVVQERNFHELSSKVAAVFVSLHAERLQAQSKTCRVYMVRNKCTGSDVCLPCSLRPTCSSSGRHMRNK